MEENNALEILKQASGYRQGLTRKDLVRQQILAFLIGIAVGRLFCLAAFSAANAKITFL